MRSFALKFSTMFAAIFLFSSSLAVAQNAAPGTASFPWKPVTLISPFTPGSSSDQELRLYQDLLTEQSRYQVIVDFKPGASGIIANSFVAKAAPDGHTLVYGNATPPILTAIRDDIPYDYLKDLAPVTLATKRIFVLTVAQSFPVNTYEEYIAYAKARPGEVTWSTLGPGGAFHMTGEWLASAAGIKLNFIHYKGNAGAELDLLAGRIHSAPNNIQNALPLAKSGKVKIIAIITSTRSPMLPGLRTVAEMGIPGFEYPSWNGLITTGGVPSATLTKLNADLVKVIRSPKAQKIWETQGSIPIGSTADEFRQLIATEIARWRKLTKDNNIKFEG